MYQSSDPVYQNPVQFQGTRVQFQCTRIQFQCTTVPVYQTSVPVYQGSDPVHQSPFRSLPSTRVQFSSVSSVRQHEFCYSSQDSAHLASGHHLAPPSITWPSPASGPRPMTSPGYPITIQCLPLCFWPPACLIVFVSGWSYFITILTVKALSFKVRMVAGDEDATSHYSLGLPCLFLLNQEDPLILTRSFFLPWMPWSSS